MRRGLGKLWDNIKHSNIQIIRVPKGKEQEQKTENLFEQIMKKKNPQSGKGNRLPGKSRKLKESQRIRVKEAHTKAHHNYITQD